MSKYFIFTDATCDLPSQFYEKDFKVIQMPYYIDGKEYLCNPCSLPYSEFYNKMSAGATPTTSMINPDTFVETFSQMLKEGYDVVYIAFSSALSGTYQSAVIAKGDLKAAFPDREVYVIDSRAASGGEGLLVWYALKKRSEGASAKELFDYVEELKYHLHHDFTVDNLFHLFRGGRVSRGAAIMGTALQLKPVLHVDDEGRLIPVSKVMGRKQSIKAMADTFGKVKGDWSQDMVFVCHGGCPDDAALLADILKEKYNLKNITIDYIGPVIGAHCGTGVLALFYLGDVK